MSIRPIEVLLAEDNPGDVRLTREALKGSRIPSRLIVAADGEEAIAYLRRLGKYANVSRPALILLDLNMPRMDGYTVLAEIRNDPELTCIPVVVLTSSAAAEDIVRSYKLRANCYITKPSDADSFISAVQAIQDFWGAVATLPPYCSD